MSKPKGAMSSPLNDADAWDLKNTLKQYECNNPKAQLKQDALMNAMLRAQDGEDHGVALRDELQKRNLLKEQQEVKEEKQPQKTSEPVADFVANTVPFDPSLKNEMIDMIISNKMQLDTVTDDKIIFVHNGKKYVLLPI